VYNGRHMGEGGDYDAFSFKADPVKHLDESPRLLHYYGDRIRKMFLTAGIVMLGTLPFLQARVSLPIFLSVIAILVLAFFAGATSPRQKWFIAGDIIISLLGFVLFAYEAISKFERVFDLLFATNIVLACILLSAFYFSVKTYRGFYRFFEKEEIGVVAEQEHLLPRAEETKINSLKTSSHLTEEERRKKRFLDRSTE